jgi:hypothetical protein
MNDIEINGFELTTLTGTRTFEIIYTDPQGNETVQENSEPFFVKGVCKTSSVITYTDAPSGTTAAASGQPSFEVYYARTANGYGVAVGGSVMWELISYKSTPYGKIYKNETNWRSVPTDLFKS